MYFADFETTTSKIDTSKSEVWLWGIKGSLEQDKLLYDVSMESFFETIYKNKMTNIFFHNLSFDGNYIFKWLLKNGFEWIDMPDVGFLELKPNQFAWINDDTKNIYSMFVNYKGHKIDFYCSFRVLMASIEKLGKAIGTEKLDLDYDAYGVYKNKKDLPAEAVEYLERDIDVARVSLQNAFAIYQKKLTTAGMSFNDFKQHYGEKKFALDFGGKVWNYRAKEFEHMNVLKKEEWDLVYRSYQGGYTSYNPKVEDRHLKNIDGYSYDVNSLYPSVMLKHKLPYGNLQYTKPHGDSATLLIIHIVYAVKKQDKMPNLFKEKGRKSVFAKYASEVYNEERVMWEEEFEFIKKYYNIKYNIIGVRYFSTKYIFSSWVKEKEHYKINAKNTVERNFHKLILNSLYGKFGQRYRRGSLELVKDGITKITYGGVDYLYNGKDRIKLIKRKNKDKVYEPALVYAESGNLLRKANAGTRYGNNLEWTHKVAYKESDELKHIGVASYITMKARLELWKATIENIDIWLYSDTDSVYCKAKPKNIEVHDSEFGAWKPEHRFSEFKVLRAKCYMYQSTHEWKGEWVEHDVLEKKISGVSQEGKELINWDNFYLGSVIQDAKRGSINVDGGKLIIKRDFAFKIKKKEL